MVRTGRVVTEKNGQVEVCFVRPEACAHCGACGGAKHHTVAQVPGSAPVGSWVDVEMPDQQVLKASVLAYVLPLGMLLVGMLIGMLIFENEALWAVLGLGCMAVAWAVLRLIDRKMGRLKKWQPRIIAIHAEGEMNNGNEADQG